MPTKPRKTVSPSGHKARTEDAAPVEAVKPPKAFFEEIRELIESARATVSRGIDLVQVHTNFEIGRRIVQEEQRGQNRAAYGEKVIQLLSERLQAEYGRGYSKSNLACMRSFYGIYKTREAIFQSVTGKSNAGSISQSVTGQLSSEAIGQQSADQLPIFQSAIGKSGSASIEQQTAAQFPILQPMVGESRSFCLSWTHYVFLLSIKNPEERSFYEIEAASQGWKVRELKRQFDSSLYERLALSRDKEGVRKLAAEGQIVTAASDLLKEPLVLEFLGLKEHSSYSESELESAIINQLESFLLELGKGFLFEARQKRFTFDSDHFFIDLVFYNRLLRCYVLIDLKIGKLTHQDLGQMQMYVNAFDRQVKLPAENPTIGIILCKQKSQALVEITLPPDAKVHAHEYQLYLPSKELLQQKLREFASSAQIERIDE